MISAGQSCNHPHIPAFLGMANWNRKLALPVPVADEGETLITLHDAALFMIRRFKGQQSAAARRTVDRLIWAAEQDSAAASEEASRQLSNFLASQRRD
ncbi:hypothetical protein V5F77_20690 [Xanthobacter sp. DSM 24535]|uniref:hypothetical protein n=1 Tax=Roseixanthobacter psychrophilus TaxID=3119917 RepID=UPI0037278AB7